MLWKYAVVTYFYHNSSFLHKYSKFLKFVLLALSPAALTKKNSLIILYASDKDDEQSEPAESTQMVENLKHNSIY